jgi:transmembrane sensor
VNKDLLKRYFDNACTPEEREKVTVWLSDARHREEALQFMDEEWGRWLPSSEALEEASREADLPFSTLFRQAVASEKKVSGGSRSLFPIRGRIVKIMAGVAACFLFLLAGAWIGFYYHGKARPDKKDPVYYAMAQTLRGQRSRVVLGDGSEVYLNADSRISFSSEVSPRQVVYLEGEAFFKVPDKEKPLIIKTKYLVASTKGSHFNISAFPRDSTVTVSVENGRTEISSNNEKTFPLLNLRFPGHDTAAQKDSVALRPKPKTMPMMAIRPIVVVNANESVVFDKYNKRATAPARLNEEELSSWKDGSIYFSHTDSAALVDKLERWFDVEVTLNTEGIPLKPLNCGFRNPTLIEVLSHISNELGLDYRIEGRHVYLSRRAK